MGIIGVVTILRDASRLRDISKRRVETEAKLTTLMGEWKSLRGSVVLKLTDRTEDAQVSIGRFISTLPWERVTRVCMRSKGDSVEHENFALVMEQIGAVRSIDHCLTFPVLGYSDAVRLRLSARVNRDGSVYAELLATARDAQHERDAERALGDFASIYGFGSAEDETEEQLEDNRRVLQQAADAIEGLMRLIKKLEEKGDSNGQEDLHRRREEEHPACLPGKPSGRS